MKEPSEITKAIQVLLRESVVGAHEEKSGYATPPIVAYGDEAGPEGERHLRDYWRTIWKRAWLIVGVVVIVGSLAAIYQARQPDVYQARAQVQVDSENLNPALGASKGGSVYVESNTYVDPEYFNTQMQILTSPTLLRRVVRDLDLERNKNFLNPRLENLGLGTSLLRMFGLKGKSNDTAANSTAVAQNQEDFVSHSASTTLNLDDPATVDRLAPLVGTLQGMLQVSQIRRTRLIDIKASHSDPLIATKIVNAIADAFALWNLEVKTKTNSIAGTYLQKRIAELQAQIRSGEEQLANYAQNHEIISLDANQNTVVDRLAGLNRQLLEAENERNLAEAAYKAGSAPGAAEASVEISDKQIAELKARLAELRQKRAQLLVTDTEASPEVRDATEQIAQVEKQLTETRNNAKSVFVINLQTNYRKAVERESALREAFQKQRAETVTQNQSAINYNILKQEIETNKGLLEGLMQRAKENDVTMAGTPNNIHVVDYSPVPKSPIGPRRLQAVGIAVVLALAFGIALALFLEYLDDTVKTTNDVERGLRLPALAVIPIASKSTARRFFPIGSMQRSNGNGNGQRSGSGHELLLNSEGTSLEAEAYRHLRTSVLLSTPGRAPKTLLVTSSVPAEGKTTTVVNTATVLAQTGASVLVIDADMRRPRLHQLFKMENARGLSSILSSNASETEILSVISQYEDSNIYLLSSGAIPPNPAELLGSEQFRRLLEVVGRSFNHVIIDSPPIASFTDGVLISSTVDGVLLVVHGGKTSRQVVKRTRQMLQEIGAKIIGVVLNKIDIRSQNYYYHHDYKDYYSPQANENEADQSLSIVGK